MNQFNKFLRSKNGRITIGVALLLLIAVVVSVVLQDNLGGLSGTVGVPQNPTYPMPENGYTCLPTCSEVDAKMFNLVGGNQYSMSNTPIYVWIMVPGDQANFKLGVFDGDTGKAADNTIQTLANGDFNSALGHWDNAKNVDTTYTLYADPLADGSGKTALNTWMGNDMLNNAWWETTIARNEQAKAPNGHYYYRLEATRSSEARGSQAFKVRASGYVMTGQSEKWAVGLVGALTNLNDLKIIYPESNGNVNALGNTMTYNGDWQLYFYLPANVQAFEIWDADFDRGSTLAPDTDDPNTDGKPEWATASTIDEGIGGGDGKGRPNDDNPGKAYRVSPSVRYEILDPAGAPIYINEDPSGTEEWESYVISSNPDDNPDILTNEQLKAGMYNVHVTGLDLFNTIWVGVNYPICDPDGGCPPPPWQEGSCPRTIGYWKNNVKKIYIQNKTNGVQESKASLDFALRNVALASPLYRSGINVENPVAIDTPTPLTPAEADAILQKAGKGNTMLARALQQNLATWMNLASGKIGPNSYIQITGIAGGDFSGTMMEALRFSEDVILNHRDDAALLERAKDIADMINNNAITTEKNEDTVAPACADYEKGSVPKDKQPPKHDDLPKAPKPTPVPVTPAPEPTKPADLTCRPDDYAFGEGYAIIALNPAACQGEQNGLLFHGTSSTTVSSAYSAGCLRSVGTHSVKGLVDYVGTDFGDLGLIEPEPTKISDPLPEEAWKIAAPMCDDPAAIQMDGKDFKGDIFLAPGLYCISGDVSINAQDNVQGSGVTLYMLNGKLDINGGSTINLSAPEGKAEDVFPALPGVLVYFAEGNSNVLLIDGNSESWYQGTIYAPESDIRVLGTGQVHGGWAQFIGFNVRVGGTADIWIDYLDRGLPACTP